MKNKLVLVQLKTDHEYLGVTAPGGVLQPIIASAKEGEPPTARYTALLRGVFQSSDESGFVLDMPDPDPNNTTVRLSIFVPWSGVAYLTAAEEQRILVP
jgi:hypothetical protein